MAEHKKWNAASMALAIIAIVAFGLYMVAFEVPFTHTAVVTQFGKIRSTYSGMNEGEVGLQFKWPWPIEQVLLFDNRIRVYETKREQLFTADEQSLTAMISIAWRIGSETEDVHKFLTVINTRENAESKLAGMAHDALGTVVGKNNFENFVSTNPERMRYEQIEQELHQMLIDQAMRNYGIEVLAVGIKRLELPEEATRKVFDRMRQEREQLARRYRAEGEGQARQIRARANLQASDIENRARSQAIAITGQGDVEAAQYYRVFAENPSLHNFIKRLETLKAILPNRSTLIMDAERVPPFDLLGSRTLQMLDAAPPPTIPAAEPSTQIVPEPIDLKVPEPDDFSETNIVQD